MFVKEFLLVLKRRIDFKENLTRRRLLFCRGCSTEHHDLCCEQLDRMVSKSDQLSLLSGESGIPISKCHPGPAELGGEGARPPQDFSESI